MSIASSKTLKYLCSLFCLLTVTTVSGEEKRQDAGLWLNISVTPKMTADRWSMIYSVEYRSRENFGETSLWSGMANVYYNFNSHFKLGAGYEYFLNKKIDGIYSSEYRFYPAAYLSFQKGFLAGSFRSCLMNTFTQWKEPHWELRNKLKMSAQLKNISLKPFVAMEPYHKICTEDDYFFNKIRYFLGFSYCFSHHHQFDIYYLCENVIHKKLINNVIAIDYNFSF